MKLERIRQKDESAKLPMAAHQDYTNPRCELPAYCVSYHQSVMWHRQLFCIVSVNATQSNPNQQCR
jgi:hypothetical protein